MDLDELFSFATQSRVNELEAALKKARESYTNGTPTVSDEVYDAWKDELASLRVDSPEVKAIGATPASEWQKVRHEIPMGSLEKVNTPEELTAWLAGIKAMASDVLVTEKLDGISVALKYDNGVLVQAATRGDGEIGEDITPNVRKMQGVPTHIATTGVMQVRGEIILTKSDLAIHFPDLKNTRNGASGVAKRLDGKGAEHLTVLVYQMAEGPEVQGRYAQLELLRKLGFRTPNYVACLAVPGLMPISDSVLALWQKYQAGRRDSLDYDIDGLVVEINHLPTLLALGEKDGRPHGARAFKFAPPARETTLRTIQSQTGATGRMTPVAVFDVVDLLGTSVTNASLYNWKYIRDLGLDVGARILVARANDVIPRVTQLITGTGTTAEPPTGCDSCGASPVWDGEYLVCPNTFDCPAQALGRLQRFVKELNVLEWGEAVLERLLAAGLVRTVPDLYRLTKDQLMGIERMGEKSADNLRKTLWGKNPLPIEVFLGGLSIPGCGSSTIALVMDAGYDTLDKLRAVKLDQLQDVKGLGPVKSAALHMWIQTHWNLVTEAQEAGLRLTERVKGTLTGFSFCFTGKTTMKRADLEAMVKDGGGTVKSSVGKGLTYLVMADPSSGTSKAQAAQKHGTKTISEDEFLKLAAGG